MLHLAILRSPLAHARIVSIDISAAEAHPKVKAVVTGAMLAEQGLAWMPTLSNDVQAVLATDKVRFQGQEVAFVVAEDRYAARDALELIDVEYEPLPAGRRRPHRARPGRAGDPRRPRRQDRQPLLRLGDRRRGRHRGGVRPRRRGGQPGHGLPAGAPGADGDVRRGGRLRRGRRQAHAVVHHPGAARAPHAVRDRRRPARAQDPGDLPGHRRRLRQQGADLPRLRLRDRRLDRHRQAGEVDGGPLGEPDQHRRSPATTSCAARSRPPGTARSSAIRTNVLADHGAFNGTAAPVEVPGRLLRGLHRQLRHRGRLLHDDRRLHQQGARRGRLRLLVPDHRGGVPGRAARRLPGLRAGDGPGRAAAAQLHPARAVPVHDARPAGSTTRATTSRPCARRWRSPATTSCAASRPRSGPAAS